MSLKIKVKYFDDEIKKIEKILKGDWIDLTAAETVTIREGEFKLIPLGVAMKIPDGYEAHLVPRSSTFKKYGIIQTNSIGIIDNSYCGNNDQWYLPVICVDPKSYINNRKITIINKGDRIAQFRIIVKNMPEVEIEEVDNLESVDRGGFGSTGY